MFEVGYEKRGSIPKLAFAVPRVRPAVAPQPVVGLVAAGVLKPTVEA